MRRVALALSLLFVASACYHAVIETGRPAGANVIDVPWAHSFLWGLVPPAVVNTAQRCPGGVSKVETQQSFVNGVANVLTWGIYTPMQITVTCAQGEEENSEPAVRTALKNAERAIQSAAMLSSIDGKPRFIELR